MPSDSELVTQLQEATKDLRWVSESDAPFEVVDWNDCSLGRLDDDTLLKLTNQPEPKPIETMDFDQFFDYPTQVQDWHGEEETAIAHQYQAIADTLKQNLHNLKVYRIGEIQLDIYILGMTDDGKIVGLATKAVET